MGVSVNGGRVKLAFFSHMAAGDQELVIYHAEGLCKSGPAHLLGSTIASKYGKVGENENQKKNKNRSIKGER